MVKSPSYPLLRSIIICVRKAGQIACWNLLHIHLLNVLPLAARTPDVVSFAKLKGKVEEVVTFAPSLTMTCVHCGLALFSRLSSTPFVGHRF